MPAGCVTTRNLSEPQRAVFHYFAGILKSPQANDCALLLVHTSSGKAPALEAKWRLLWDGARPGDDRERFWLYQLSAR